MPIDSLKMAFLTPQLPLRAPQLSQKTAFWWLTNKKSAILAVMLKKYAISDYLVAVALAYGKRKI